MSSSDESVNPRGPYAKGIQRRREILDRALEVFAEKGSQSTSLRAIGEAIGVSHAALTHYFESREALLVEVLRERDAQGHERIMAADGVIGPLIEAAAINVQIPGIVALHTVMMATAVEEGHEAATEFFTERFENGRRSIEESLAEALRDADQTPDVDLRAFAALVMAASDGLQIQWLLDPTIDIAGSLALLRRILTP